VISARSERAYSRSILKRLKMFKTLSSANTFRIRLKNISSDNTHLCFSSRRAHKIEEEIQIYSQLCVFTFASAQKRKSCFFARDAETFLVLLKNISSDNTHLCFSSRRAHKIEEEIQIYSQLCVFTFASAQKRKSCFFTQNTSDKNFQKFDRFLAQKWSNNTDDDGGATTSKIESVRTTADIETYENGEIWSARSRTRKRFRKSSPESN